MENRSYALAVGVFTLLMSAALAFALWWFSGRSVPTYELTLVAGASVGGLNPQSAVRFRGLRAGQVTGIELDPQSPRQILVHTRLVTSVTVTRATRARLATQGITGGVFVQLDDDGSDPTPLVLPARVALASGSGGIMEVAAEALVAARQVADRLALVLDEKNRRQIDASLAHLASASARLDAALARAPGVLDRADHVLARLDSEKIDHSLANIERGTAQLPATVAELRQTLAAMQKLSARWETVGADLQTQVLADGGAQAGQTLEELHRLSGELNSLISNLQRNPQSLMFGQGTPAPGPGEAGFRAPPAP